MIVLDRQALRWKTRPTRERTIAAERTIWQTSCGHFRVVRSQSLFGLPTAFYAMTIGTAGEWAIIGRHRKRGPAFKRCGESFRRDLRLRAGGVS